MRASLLRWEKSISVTSAILINKVQPCPTSSVSELARDRVHEESSLFTNLKLENFLVLFFFINFMQEPTEKQALGQVAH